MKKTLVASIIGIVGSVASVHGQGQIVFNNYISASYLPVVYNSNATLAPTGLAGKNVNDAGVEVQLFYAPGTFSSLSSFLSAATAGGTTFINTGINTAGTTSGGTGPGGYYTASTPQVLTGWTPTGVDSTVTFLVEAWQTAGQFAGGGTFATSLMTGMSGLWTEGPAPDANSNGIQPTTGIAAGFAGGPPLTVMSIAPVPEPTTLALAGLGGLASLVMLRRKHA
jgi:PEP-CTERM motif-containing protein